MKAEDKKPSESRVKRLYGLVVNRISLVSSTEKPAVPKAETGYAIFKSFKESIFTRDVKEKLEELEKKIRSKTQ